MSGLPGTGKSLVADGIARARGLPVLSVDPIESAILRSGVARGFETGLAAYLVAETLADAFLAAQLDTIIDAVNSVEPAREMWRLLASRRDAPLRIIECVVGDDAVHRARLRERRRDLATGEPSWTDVESRRVEWSPWPEPHLTLEATDDPAANVERALSYVGSGKPSPRPGRSG